MSDVTYMAVIYHTAKGNVQMTDVKFCGGYIFVSMKDLINLDEGIVQVYKRYDKVNETLQLVADITGINKFIFVFYFLYISFILS